MFHYIKYRNFAIKKRCKICDLLNYLSQDIFNKIPERWWNFPSMFGINGIIWLPQFITTTRTIYINSSVSSSLCRRHTDLFFGTITGFHIFINVCHDYSPFYKKSRHYHTNIKIKNTQIKLLNLLFFIQCLSFWFCPHSSVGRALGREPRSAVGSNPAGGTINIKKTHYNESFFINSYINSCHQIWIVLFSYEYGNITPEKLCVLSFILESHHKFFIYKSQWNIK